MRKHRSIFPALAILFASPALRAGDVTLNALMQDKLPAEERSLKRDLDLASAFVIYCNDLPAVAATNTDETISDIARHAAGSLGAVSAAHTAYDQATYLAMHFAGSFQAEPDVAQRRYGDIHDVLWRLFLADSAGRSSGPPGTMVDWLMLASGNSSSFDYSRWRF